MKWGFQRKKYAPGNENAVKRVLVATSIMQATYIKQACIQFPKQAYTL